MSALSIVIMIFWGINLFYRCKKDNHYDTTGLNDVTGTDLSDIYRQASTQKAIKQK